MGSCRHHYCLQQAVCTVIGQLQTQILPSAGCLFRYWAAADTSTAFSRLSVKLLGSCRYKYCLQQAVCTGGGQLQTPVLSSAGCLYSYWAAADKNTVFNRLSVQLVGSCRHKYCLQQAVCTVIGQLQTQILSSAGYLYSWWAAVYTNTVFSRLSVQLVGSWTLRMIKLWKYYWKNMCCLH